MKEGFFTCFNSPADTTLLSPLPIPICPTSAPLACICFLQDLVFLLLQQTKKFFPFICLLHSLLLSLSFFSSISFGGHKTGRKHKTKGQGKPWCIFCVFYSSVFYKESQDRWYCKKQKIPFPPLSHSQSFTCKENSLKVSKKRKPPKNCNMGKDNMFQSTLGSSDITLKIHCG